METGKKLSEIIPNYKEYFQAKENIKVKNKKNFENYKPYKNFIEKLGDIYTPFVFNSLKLEEKAILEAYLKRFAFLQYYLEAKVFKIILENKPALDALVINPRVCGICGHSHLIATVKALEDCYDNLIISDKAKILRELTLNFEIIINHLKWFYFTIMPLFGYKQYLLKAMKMVNNLNKAIAIIGGQYPHNSYAIVGGVICVPTQFDLIKIINYIDIISIFLIP